MAGAAIRTYLSCMKHFNGRFLLAGLAAAATMWLMVWHGAWLQTASTPLGILDLELARTTSRLEEINQAWYSRSHHATWNIIWDFFFLMAYSSFFYHGLHMAWKHWQLLSRWGLRWGWVALLAFLPGIIDAFENIIMLWWLGGHPEVFSPGVLYWLVWAKFAMAAAWLLISLPFWLLNLGRLIKRR